MAFLPTEVKEVNREDFKDSFDRAQKEIARLHVVIQELDSWNGKLNSKLLKKKEELENEKSSLQTFKQLISELNARLETRDLTPPHSATFLNPPGTQFPFPDSIETQKLKSENSDLQLRVRQQQHTIDSLSSELASYKRRGIMEIPQPQHNVVDLSHQIINQHINKTKQLEDPPHLECMPLEGESDTFKCGAPRLRGNAPNRCSTPPSIRSTKIEQKTRRDDTVLYRTFTPKTKPKPHKDTIAKGDIPSIKLILNTTTKPSSKIQLRAGVSVNVVKLTHFCKAAGDAIGSVKQVVVLVNKRYELGLLMGIFEVDTKAGFRNSMTRFAGVRLYNAGGSSDGESGGKFYFECEDNCGLFMPVQEVLVPVL